MHSIVVEIPTIILSPSHHRCHSHLYLHSHYSITVENPTRVALLLRLQYMHACVGEEKRRLHEFLTTHAACVLVVVIRTDLWACAINCVPLRRPATCVLRFRRLLQAPTSTPKARMSHEKLCIPCNDNGYKGVCVACHRHHHHQRSPYTFETSKWMAVALVLCRYITQHITHTHACHNLLKLILTYYLVTSSIEAAELQAFLAAMENIKWFG